MPFLRKIILFVAGFLFFTTASRAQWSDSLFLRPTPDFTPAARWIWPDDSISNEGINLDLEALSTAGFNTIWLQLDRGADRKSAVVRGNRRFEELYKHAQEQAARLGLNLCLDSSAWRVHAPALILDSRQGAQTYTPFELQENLNLQLQHLNKLLQSGGTSMYLNALLHRPEAYRPPNEMLLSDRYQPMLQKISLFLPALARIHYVFSQSRRAAVVACLGDTPVDASGLVHPDWSALKEEDLAGSAVQQQMLNTRDGRQFQVLYIQDGQAVNLSTLVLLRDLLSDGLQLVAGKPRSAGVLSVAEKKKWDALVQEIWGNLPDGIYRLGAGRLYYHTPAETWLEATHGNQIACYQSLRPLDLRFEHLKIGSMDAWWIESLSNRTDTILANFPVLRQKPELFNPWQGTVDRATFYQQLDGKTFVPLVVVPGQPLLVVFRTATGAEQGKMLLHDDKIRWSSSPDLFEKLVRPAVKDSLPDVLLSGANCFIRGKGVYKLEVRYSKGQPVGKSSLKQDLPYYRLIRGWTCKSADRSDAPVTEADSLTAPCTAAGDRLEWKKTFVLTQQELSSGRWFLELGNPVNGADLIVNGQAAGFLWHEPFRADVTALLKPGLNVLQIQTDSSVDAGSRLSPVTISAWKKL